MNVTRIIRLFRKWAWLIILAVVLGGGVSFIANSNRLPAYQAQTKILIGGFIASPNPNRGEIDTSSSLAETYLDLVTTSNVLQGAIDALQLPLTVKELRQSVTAAKPRDTTPIIIIQVTQSEPDRAVALANEIAQQLILKSPTNLTPAQQAQIDLANQQIEFLTLQVEDARNQLRDLDARLAGDPAGASQINPLTQQRNALIEQINQATATIAQFSATISDLQSRVNSIDIIEQATEALPVSTGPGRLETSVLSAIVGLILAIAAILLIDYLDSSLRTSQEVNQSLGLPVVGTIPSIGKPKANYADRLIHLLPTQSPISEAYRTLQTNLLYSRDNNAQGVYLITSAGANEGKSVTAANLAISIASSGLPVLMIDADLRQPKQHDIFGLENEIGLARLLTNPAPDSSGDGQISEEEMRQALQMANFCIQDSGIPNLRIITSGSRVDNPAMILSSHALQQWINLFQSHLGVSVVVIDTPPCLVVADTSIVAATVACEPLLVVHAGKTTLEAAQRAQNQFVQIGNSIKGVILNQVKLYDVDHGYVSEQLSPQLTALRSGDKLSLNRYLQAEHDSFVNGNTAYKPVRNQPEDPVN